MGSTPSLPPPHVTCVVVSKDFEVVSKVDDATNSLKSCRMGCKSVPKSVSYTGKLITCSQKEVPADIFVWFP